MIEKKHRYVIIPYIMIFLLPNAGLAQGLQHPPKQNPFKSFAFTVGGDVLHVMSSPLRFRQNDGLKLLTFIATTTLFMTLLDSRINEDFIARDDFYVKPGIGLAKIGHGFDRVSPQYALAGLTVPMLAGALILKDRKLLETTRLMLESFVIAGGITYVGKRVFGRARPYTGEGPHDFEPFKFTVKGERRSFPSGHATSAFAMMTVVAKQYEQWWIRIPAYTAALSVSFQRIESRNHWGADVLVGSTIGYWVGNMLVSRYQQPSRKTAINPYILKNRIAFMVSF